MKKVYTIFSRYCRLYLQFVRVSFATASAFRLDSIFRFVMDLTFYGITFLYSNTLYRYTGSLGGFNEDQFMVFLSSYLLIDALSMAFFNDGLYRLMGYVSKGEFDFHLLRPVSPFFITIFREINLASAFNVLVVLVTFGWSLLQNQDSINLYNLALFIIFLVIAIILSFIMRALMALPVFWVPSADGWWQSYFALTYLSRIPDRILNVWVRRLLLTFLPFALFASVPTRVLFEGASLSTIALTGLVVTFFTLLASIIWKAGLRSYGSPSS